MNKFKWAFNKPELSRALLELTQTIYKQELEEYLMIFFAFSLRLKPIFQA